MVYVNEQTRGIYEAYTWQVREKELTHLRAGLLMTVVKWGKVELFNRVVDDSKFADQRSPALVQQAFQLGLKLAGNTKQFDVKACTHMIAYDHNTRARITSHALHAHHMHCTRTASHALHAHHMHCMRTRS